MIGFYLTDTSIQESIINLLREPQQTWNHFNQRHNSLLSGKPWLNMLVTISELEDLLTLRNLVALHSMFKLSYLRFMDKNMSTQRSISSLRDKKERTFIIWSQFSWLINHFKLIWADIQVKKKSQQPKVNIRFTNKVTDAFMPTLFQLLQLQCLELMLLRMLLRHFSWLWPILSSMVETLIWHGVSQMWDALIKTWAQFLLMIWQELLEMHNSKTKWLDKNHQFQLCGPPHTIKPGPIQLLDHWLRNQIIKWQLHWTRRQLPSKSWVLIFHPLAVSSTHQRIEKKI